MPSPRAALAAALALSAAGVATGFAVGRATAPRGVDAGDFGAPAAGLPTRPDPLGRDAGSVWRARFASAPADEGKESVLLTPRPGDLECTEDCPLALRVHGGERGRAERDKVMRSLDAALADLVAAARPESPPFAAALEAALADLRRRAAADPGDGRVPRILMIGLPRPEYGPRHYGVHLVAYAQHDPHFDLKAPGPPLGGMRVSISRIEGCDEGADRCSLVAGDVSVAEFVPGAPDVARDPSDAAAAVATLRGPSLGHFRGASGRQIGLLLSPDGGVSVYEADLRPRPLAASASLRRALSALLRRI